MSNITGDQHGKEFWANAFGADTLEVDFETFTKAIEEYFTVRDCLPEAGTNPRLICQVLFLGNNLQPKNINQPQFNLFLRRFGAFPGSLRKAAKSLFGSDNIHPWFHGAIGRTEAERVIQQGTPGTFLFRFSEQHPSNFSLTYKKQDGQLRNCLMYNISDKGIGVKNGQQVVEQHDSILAFINANRTQLVHPAESRLYKDIKARQAQAASLTVEPLNLLRPPTRNTNFYTSGQNAYTRCKDMYTFDAGPYTPAGLSPACNYAPAGFPNSQPPSAAYEAIGFDVGEQSNYIGGAYAVIGFNSNEASNYSTLGFYESFGPGSYILPPPPYARSHSDLEMPANNPGTGPYTPAFLTTQEEDLDDLPPLSPIVPVFMRNDSRCGDDPKKKKERAIELWMKSSQSSEHFTEMAEKVSNLLEEVVHDTETLSSWSDQILQFQSLLFLGEVYLKDDKADLAIDRLNQCYFKIEQAEESLLQDTDNPKTLLNISNQKKQLQGLRPQLHEKQGLAYLKKGDSTKCVQHFEELIGCTEDDSIRTKWREVLVQLVGEHILQNYSKEQLELVFNDAKQLFQEGQLEKAADNFRQAIGVARLGNHLLEEGRALGNLATVNKKLGRIPCALRYYKDSIRIFHKLNDSKMERTMLNAMSICCLDANRFFGAKKYCEQLLQISCNKQTKEMCCERLKKIEGLIAQANSQMDVS